MYKLPPARSTGLGIGRCLLVCLITTLFYLNAEASEPLSSSVEAKKEQEKAPETFYLGKVTSNPRKHYKRVQPMASYLAPKLGYAQGAATFTRSLHDMVQVIKQGKVDMFSGSAYEVAIIMQSGAGELIALKSKRGVNQYRTVIAVRTDSGIDSIEQLRGKTIAFEDPDSTSAYRVPFMELSEAGYQLREHRARPSNKDVIHYRFSGSEQNSSAWLYRGTVDAIALSDLDWANSKNVPIFQRDEFKIIYSSAPIPRALELVRTDMPDETKTQLQKILLDLHEDRQAEFAMSAYHGTTEFSPISETTAAYLARLASYYKNQEL